MVSMFKTSIFLSILIINMLVIADDYKNNDCNGLAKVYFKNITDGFISNDNNLLIEFGSENIDILPITKMPDKNAKCVSGHHHLIVDSELPNLKRPIPSGKNYLHFGKGQTETVIDLPKGKHSLQLLLGDYMHVPHEEPLFSEKILQAFKTFEFDKC